MLGLDRQVLAHHRSVDWGNFCGHLLALLEARFLEPVSNRDLLQRFSKRDQERPVGRCYRSRSQERSKVLLSSQ